MYCLLAPCVYYVFFSLDAIEAPEVLLTLLLSQVWSKRELLFLYVTHSYAIPLPKPLICGVNSVSKFPS